LDSLRIALLVKALPLHRPGGQENHAWDLARGLVEEGHHVTIVTSAHPAGETETAIDGVRVVHLSGTAPGRNSAALFARVGRWAQAFEGEFDILHAQGFAAMWVRPGKTPLVSTVHGTVWSETPLARQVRPLLSAGEKLAALWRFAPRTLLGPLAHRQWRRSARLVCDSAFTRNELLRLNPRWADRIAVVPLGIALLREVPSRDENLEGRQIQLLTVGRLVKIRGLNDLLEALASLPEKGRFRLTVVGDGPHLFMLERHAEALGLTEIVRFTGQVDAESLAHHWREADLFVNPEWSQPAFGLVSLEALGWGLPVLGTRTGATPEIITDDVGWLVSPGRPGALGERLARLASTPGLIRERRQAARRRAEAFPISAMVEGTVEAYRRVL
jgi:glycosyltransferase involved in cell wall biosynthesis